MSPATALRASCFAAANPCWLPLLLPLLLLPPQAKAGRALPLAIMTSDDTHQRTLDLLERHAYWGATSPGQVTLIKQEKVACLAGGWEGVGG